MGDERPLTHRDVGPRKWSTEQVRDELRWFVEGRRRWPAKAEFESADRLDLWHAMERTGGARHWAPQLGFRLRHNQDRRLLSDRDAARQAARVIERLGYLPNAKALRRRGRKKLATAVTRAGGAGAFCELHGLVTRFAGDEAP